MSMHDAQQPPRSDVPARWIGLGLVAVFVVVALSYVALRPFFGVDAVRPVPSATLDSAPQARPAPALQAQPVEDLHAMRERDARILSSYAWVDRDNGIARIPITRAMEILADQSTTGEAACSRDTPNDC